MSDFTHGSLFSGAGGMDTGFEQAGIPTKWRVELLDGQDITTTDAGQLEQVDVISGGPVCRRTSVAAGFHKSQTNESLWPHMLRIVSANRPTWVVVEQPASVDRSVILGWVQDLERCGYGVAARIIDSKHWLPQQRARWYVLARLGITGLALWDYAYAGRLGVEGEDIYWGEGLRFAGNCPDCLPGGIFARVSERKIALMGAGNAVSVPVARYLAGTILRVERVISTEHEIETKKGGERRWTPLGGKRDCRPQQDAHYETGHSVGFALFVRARLQAN